MKTPLLLCSVLTVALVLPLAAADNLPGAPAEGNFSVNLRLRYEDVAQTGLRDAAALTLRTRLGYHPAPLHGWSVLLEAENITAADSDRYSQAGLNPGGTGRAVVPDPEGTEINQALLRGTLDRTTLTLGRQQLILDNARFVGDSGWRQNMQTFDAVVVQDKSLDHTTLTYAYLDRINRVFGDRHPSGYWQSDSHLLNASYSGLPAGTLTGYAYLLDFKSAAAQSCATYGASFTGSEKISAAAKLTYRAECATQTNYGASPPGYAARYYVVEAGLAGAPGSLTLGREVLGSDQGVGFKTPLATLHAFNGWADLFLTTPATGLRDTYVKGAASLPAGLSLLVFHHWFTADRAGPDPGREFDLQLTRKFGPQVTGLLKYANFRREAAAYPNVQKIWAQVEFAL